MRRRGTRSRLGDADGDSPGGLAILDARDFSIAGRWESEPADLQFMYDFWYQPRQNTLVSSEWGAPNTFQDGFDPADVAAGKYGRRLHFWDLEQRRQVQTLDLGDDGWIPLELRWQHDPNSRQGFVGVTLSSTIKRFFSDNGSWDAETVIDVANEPLEGWPLEGGVPGLITDLVLSLDDRDLFFSNWLHGDLRHYDVSDPRHPELRSQVWLGGLLGRDGGHPKASGPLTGGPQMLQNSLDGERVYVSNSLYSTWDNQFYPGIQGWLTKLDRQPDGSFALDEDFFVDFAAATDGARPHEIHLPGGDCTTEIAAADTHLSDHMVEHMAMWLIVAPLLAAAAPVRLTLFALGPRGRRRVGVALHSRPARALLGPVGSIALFDLVVILGQLPAVYALTARSDLVHVIEHALYLASATLVWAPIVGADPIPHRPGARGHAAGMAACMLPMAAIGVWLLCARAPVYAACEAALGRDGALRDQRVAGVIMLACGVPAFALPLLAQRRRRRRSIRPRVYGTSGLGIPGRVRGSEVR